MNTGNNRHIDTLIGEVLADNVPADVDRRLRRQLEDFRGRLGEERKPTARRSAAVRLRVWIGASAAAIAVAVYGCLDPMARRESC